MAKVYRRELSRAAAAAEYDAESANRPAEGSVFTPTKDYMEMRKRFALPEALMGGTNRMRAEGVRYMPAYSNEDSTRYQRRLNGAVLFESFRKSVQNLSSRPFGKAVQVDEDADGFWVDFCKDVDREGTSLTSFCKGMMSDLLVYGKAHLLVDFPDTEGLSGELGRPLTLADEKQYGLRPYFSSVSPKSVIGWKSDRIAGVQTLTELRIAQTSYDYVDEYDQEEVERVFCWKRDEIKIYRKTVDESTGEVGELLESIQPNTLGIIPLVTVYAQKQDYMVSYPPLEGLAHLNQKHWWMQADQDNIETVARVPMMFFRGFNSEDLGALEVGPYKIFGNRSPESDIKVVETSGKAVEVGSMALKRLEAQMERMSLEPLIRKAGAITATEVAVDERRNMSHMEAYTLLLETGIEEAFMIVALWTGSLSVPSINIDKDSSHIDLSDRVLEELRLDYTMGVIDQRTYLEHRKNRGLYSEDMDIDEVMSEAQNEDALGLDGNGIQEEEKEEEEG